MAATGNGGRDDSTDRMQMGMAGPDRLRWHLPRPEGRGFLPASSGLGPATSTCRLPLVPAHFRACAAKQAPPALTAIPLRRRSLPRLRRHGLCDRNAGTGTRTAPSGFPHLPPRRPGSSMKCRRGIPAADAGLGLCLARAGRFAAQLVKLLSATSPTCRPVSSGFTHGVCLTAKEPAFFSDADGCCDTLMAAGASGQSGSCAGFPRRNLFRGSGYCFGSEHKIVPVYDRFLWTFRVSRQFF